MVEFGRIKNTVSQNQNYVGLILCNPIDDALKNMTPVTWGLSIYTEKEAEY